MSMLPEKLQSYLGPDATLALVISDDYVQFNNTPLTVNTLGDTLHVNQAYFQKVMQASQQPVTTYRPADDTLVIELGAEVVVEQPIHVIYLHKEAMFRRHILLISQPLSEAKIIEHHLLDDEQKPMLIEQTLEVVVRDGAKLEYASFDAFTQTTQLRMSRFGLVERFGSLTWSLGAFSSGDTQTDNITQLVGEGATCQSTLMTIGMGEQIQTHLVRIDQLAPHTSGIITNHGVMRERARGTFDGIGFIEKGAVKANAQQESRFMVLDDSAKATTNPILLIDEHDVTAGHAASVGRIDEETLYYLQSRGLTNQEANALVTLGFLMPLLESITDQTLREKLLQVIETKVNYHGTK
ncbi:MAG: SufD family Fe-S cluster assembly protein [Culicoidibacterales bacterium]